MGEPLGYLRLTSNIVAPALAAVESVGPKQVAVKQ